MWPRRRKHRHAGSSSSALADRAAVDRKRTVEELRSEIEALTEANRTSSDCRREKHLLKLRNLAGIGQLQTPAAISEHPEPDFRGLPEADGLPEFRADEVTPQLLRAAILRDGCLLVRGLIASDEALRFAQRIDRSFAERERHDRGEPFDERHYCEFTPDPEVGDELTRLWIKQGGGLLGVDAPQPSFALFHLLRASGLPELVERYLGEAPLIAAQKTTLRKANPSVAGAWHQDGKFMGSVRALNLWLPLSRCGDRSPGLDIVPRRLDRYITTQTEEAVLDYIVSQRMAETAAGDRRIISPIFEAGDALLFDELFLHKTGSDPSMTNPRFAVENWFFGSSGFPPQYAPLSV